ncbi:GGDEF domain-containing protein [Undibacter mobilis]|uniref:GGDEF domain-containing protein n=1 Tax=Undibacter mobilis TaxID=2292256 RepID=A0A371BCY1_9BRAD|nr:GGDEF domain-containing protein [Undibacter mobilis]
METGDLRPATAAQTADRAPARASLSSSRMIVLLALVVLLATMVSTGVGYQVARHQDETLAMEQRTALRNAVAEFRALFGHEREIDPRFVRMVEQSARLKNLQFEVAPADDGREIQPVLDTEGRITGFFTWQRTSPMAATAKAVMPFVAALAMALAGFAGFSVWHLRRASRELSESEALARRAADVDKITGLPNHAKMLELLDLALAERMPGETTTFAVFEIDGIADITANFGVLGSDELIIALADRIREATPDGAVCARIGSDEFAMLLTAPDATDIGKIIASVIENFARPHWFETVVRVSAHAGFAQAPHHAATRGELTRRAELALRAAVKKGPGAWVAFETPLDTISTDQKFIQRELPRAVSAHELELHYQPIIAAHGGRIIGVEALLRWTHPQRGPIGPAVFIPIAEQMGLMDVIGAFVLRRALQEAKRWPDLYVAVNLSPLQVRDGSIVDTVRAALAESGVPPSRLMLEITEGVLIDNPEEMVRRIEDLHALGVRVALDDFGSGYSNLSYLQRFPLDKLKIDRSFVTALGTSANGGVIIQAIVALGRALGLSILVEGVETEQQRVLLRLAGCDEMQGFLFARPAPAATIDRLLAQQKQNGGKALPASGGNEGEALTA